MQIENKRFLPIGTVVLLKNGEKKLMITAYGVFSTTSKDKLYEYGGCLYPEGIIDSNDICAFNHEDIEQVYHLGYASDDWMNYNKIMEENFDVYKKNIEDK